jgi:hypothetical protein
MRPISLFMVALCLILTQGVLFAELFDGTAEEYEREKTRREKHLLAGPCASDYQRFCPDEPVISGRRAVWTCLSQQKITSGCKQYLMRVAPDLFGDTPLYNLETEFGMDREPPYEAPPELEPEPY